MRHAKNAFQPAVAISGQRSPGLAADDGLRAVQVRVLETRTKAGLGVEVKQRPALELNFP